MVNLSKGFSTPVNLRLGLDPEALAVPAGLFLVCVLAVCSAHFRNLGCAMALLAGIILDAYCAWRPFRQVRGEIYLSSRGWILRHGSGSAEIVERAKTPLLITPWVIRVRVATVRGRRAVLWIWRSDQQPAHWRRFLVRLRFPRQARRDDLE